MIMLCGKRIREMKVKCAPFDWAREDGSVFIFKY